MTIKKALASAADSLRDDFGNLERRYAADVLLVPPVVELRGEWLHWSFGRKMTMETKWAALHHGLQNRARVDVSRDLWRARRVPPGGNLLGAFARLGDAPSSRILAFAKRWGVLGICKHNLPSGHALECVPHGWDGERGREPLETWRSYARRTRALLLVASRLRQAPRKTKAGELVFPWTADELQPIAREIAKVLLVADRLEPPTLHFLDMRQMLVSVVNEWIAEGGVRPWLLLSGTTHYARTKVVLATGFKALEPEFPLFGVLAMQLAFAASAERGIEFCDSCGTTFEPGRQARAGVLHYCDECRGSGAMQRHASRAYRARQRLKSSG